MVDVKEEKKNTLPAPFDEFVDAPAVSPQISPPPAEQKTAATKDDKRGFVSAGEKIHHWTTYLTVDWVYNATVGAIFAYWGKFTPSGKKIWSNNIDWAFTKILQPFLKNPEHLKEGVKQGNTFMSIIAGGMLTIPPLLILEKGSVKKSIAKAIDRVIYGKEKVEHDPKFQQAYEELENAPKKDFWTGMTSRFAALAPLLLSVLIPSSKDWLVKNVFSHVGAASKKVVAGVGLPPEKIFKKFSEAERAERWKYVHDDAVAMDLSFGLPYAVLHSFFYNMFAGDKDKKKKKNGAGMETKIAEAELLPVTNIIAEQSAAEPATQPANYTSKINEKPAIAPRAQQFTDYAEKTNTEGLQAAL